MMEVLFKEEVLVGAHLLFIASFASLLANAFMLEET